MMHAPPRSDEWTDVQKMQFLHSTAVSILSEFGGWFGCEEHFDLDSGEPYWVFDQCDGWRSGWQEVLAR